MLSLDDGLFAHYLQVLVEAYIVIRFVRAFRVRHYTLAEVFIVELRACDDRLVAVFYQYFSSFEDVESIVNTAFDILLNRDLGRSILRFFNWRVTVI